MRSRLVAAGLTPAAVKKKRGTDDFVVEWFEPGMNTPVKPVSHYAQQLRDAFEGIRILKTGETVATWRPGQPVIAASVMFADEDMLERAVAPVVDVLLRLPADIVRSIVPLRLRVLLRRLMDLAKASAIAPVMPMPAHAGGLLLPAPVPVPLLPAVAGVYQ